MTTRLVALAFALAAALTACSHGKPEAVRPIPERTGMVAPVTISWVAGATGAGSLSLIAQLQVAPTLVAPLEVTVAVPAGVTIAAGAAAFQVLPGQSGSLSYPYAFDVPAGTMGEIVLRADIGGAGPGLHAKASWPVGAPALKRAATTPEASGPPVKILGKDLGPAVPIKN